MSCEHENVRPVAIIGMDVTWVVCNDCDVLVGVLKGYVGSEELPSRRLKKLKSSSPDNEGS